MTIFRALQVHRWGHQNYLLVDLCHPFASQLVVHRHPFGTILLLQRRLLLKHSINWWTLYPRSIRFYPFYRPSELWNFLLWDQHHNRLCRPWILERTLTRDSCIDQNFEYFDMRRLKSDFQTSKFNLFRV